MKQGVDHGFPLGFEKTSGKNGDKKALYRTNKKKRAIKAQIITVITPKRGKLN